MMNQKIIQEKPEDKINFDLYLAQEKLRIHSYLWKMKLINLIILVPAMLFIREKTTAAEINDKTMVQENNKSALSCFTDSQTPVNVRFSLPGRIVFSGRESPEISESPYSRITYKQPGLSFLFSLLLPGGGQYYNKQFVKGGIMTGLDVAGCALIAVGWNNTVNKFFRRPDNFQTSGLIITGSLIVAGVTLWSVIDATVVTVLNNKRINYRLSKNVNLQIRPDCSLDNPFTAEKRKWLPSVGMKFSLTIR